MKVIAIAALVILLAGCATMARGMTQSLEVVSEPPGASVATSNGLSCPATPCKLEKVSREAKFKVTLNKSGYRTATADITHETSAAGAAAVAASFAIPGGILWSLIDANFGASQDLTPNPVIVKLEPAEGAGASAD
jgi:hypothetical protein